MKMNKGNGPLSVAIPKGNLNPELLESSHLQHWKGMKRQIAAWSFCCFVTIAAAQPGSVAPVGRSVQNPQPGQGGAPRTSVAQPAANAQQGPNVPQAQLPPSASGRPATSAPGARLVGGTTNQFQPQPASAQMATNRLLRGQQPALTAERLNRTNAQAAMIAIQPSGSRSTSGIAAVQIPMRTIPLRTIPLRQIAEQPIPVANLTNASNAQVQGPYGLTK